MSKWFIIILTLVVLSSVVAIVIRIEGRKEVDKLENDDFSADDFDITEF